MRLTRSDRLVFQITDGDMTNGIAGIKILEASGHYPNEGKYDGWSKQDGVRIILTNNDDKKYDMSGSSAASGAGAGSPAPKLAKRSNRRGRHR